MQVCAGIVVLLPGAVWVGVALYSHRQATLHHSRIGPLTWRAIFDPNSYDEIGQRLLRRSERMFWGFLPLGFVMALVAHLLCPGDF